MSGRTAARQSEFRDDLLNATASPNIAIQQKRPFSSAHHRNFHRITPRTRLLQNRQLLMIFGTLRRQLAIYIQYGVVGYHQCNDTDHQWVTHFRRNVMAYRRNQALVRIDTAVAANSIYHFVFLITTGLVINYPDRLLTFLVKNSQLGTSTCLQPAR